MLYINTSLDSIDKSKFVDDVDIYFNFDLANNLKSDKIIDRILEVIDGAHIIAGNVVETKFGVTTLSNLSTGCKALIIAYLNPRLTVNFILVGDNVIELAVEISKDNDLNIYTRNSVVFGKNLDTVINLDGKEMTAKEYIEYTVFGRC